MNPIRFLFLLFVVMVTLSGCAREPLIIEPYPTQSTHAVLTSTTTSLTNYILNTNTKKFHLSSCSGTAKIKPENKELFVGNRDELLTKQYIPCGICKP